MNTQSNKGNPIYIIGQELILEFTEEISQTIEQYLYSKWGHDWEIECLLPDRENHVVNLKDFGFICRQILELNNQHFRLAIAQSYFARLTLEKPHLLAIEMTRKSRNLWAHPDKVINKKDLDTLAFNIMALLPNEHQLAIKCKKILGISDSNNYANKIASLTSISELYSHTIEYRSEFATALKDFASISKKLKINLEMKEAFDTVYHTLLSTAANYMTLQALYYQLLLDQLIKYKDPRTGRRINGEIIAKFNRDIDTENSLKMAFDFINDLKSTIEMDECNCELCKITGTGLIADMREISHQEIDAYYMKRLTKNGDFKLLDSDLGPLPPLLILIMPILVAKLNLDVHVVYSEWSFDLINPELSLFDNAYSDENVLNAAMKMIAIRNGIDPNIVYKTNFLL